MKLLAVSIVPIYKDHVEGGAQKILMEVLRDFAGQHEVRLLCTQRSDNRKPFNLCKDLKVLPVLKFRPHWPFPYMINPRDLLDIISKIRREAEWADAIFFNSDGIYFKHLLRGLKKPLITSLHDFLYPMSITSAILPEADKVIVPSGYVKECIRHSIGGLYRGYMDRIVVINCGVDHKVFSRDEAGRTALRAEMGLKSGEFCMLFPHRPDHSKGIPESIKLLVRLRAKGVPAKLLFLKHVDIKTRPELLEDYQQIESELKACGMLEHALFRDWLPYGRMRSVYSAADVTLNLGNFVESFGLAPVESALCGTPVIASRVGCLRHNLKDLPGVFLHEYGDIRTAVRAGEHIYSRRPDMRAAREKLRKEFPFKGMLDRYSSEFINAVVRPVPVAVCQQPTAMRYRLAPWCDLSKTGIYDDYAGKHMRLSAVQRRTLSRGEFMVRGVPWLRKLAGLNCIVPAV